MLISVFCFIRVSLVLSMFISLGMFRITNLGFLGFWTFVSSSLPHLSLIPSSSSSISFLLPTSIITLPSLKVLSDWTPTFMSVNFTFSFNKFCTSSGVWVLLVVTVNLNFLSLRSAATLEYSLGVLPIDGRCWLLAVFVVIVSLSLGISLVLRACAVCIPTSVRWLHVSASS